MGAMEAMTEAGQRSEPMKQSLMEQPFIEERIPHRAPFLWLDRILELDEATIRAEKFLPADLDVFQGHYPDYPIMPGVLLCEAVFQAGALLIGETLRGKEEIQGVPVLTRIIGAKFKREVRPGDTVEIRAALKEKLGPAWFMKGSVRVKGKVAVQVEFACALKG
jgi:3-hydroxyacyl-[acyl-carrier-protein] dehydratase